MAVTIWPVEGLPEIREGDDLGALIAGRAELEDGDVIVVAQKAISKAEGRIVRLAEVEASAEARELAADHDPRQLEVILREAARLVRTRPPLVIAETRHGFVCASAGVDASNAPEPDMVVLATKSNAALETGAALADAIGDTPVLCVASDLRFTDIGIVPGLEEGSLAENLAELLRAPVASGLQSISAIDLSGPEPPDQDALICGDDPRAKGLALELEIGRAHV